MKCTVGIDVSKAKLDVAFLCPKGKFTCFEVTNNLAGYKKFFEKVRKLAQATMPLFCMEVTASYHLNLAIFLSDAGQSVCVENPRRIKHFGVASGATQKTDRADAKVIALYASKMQPRAWKQPEPHLRELVALDRRITELKALANQESNRLEAPGLPKLVSQGILASIKEFKKQIKALEARTQQILKDNQELGEQVTLLQTVPGMGPRGAVGLLAEVGDIENYDKAQDLAAKLGLNPVHKRSGSSIHGRTKISKAGNAHARSRLYLPALCATRYNPIIKEFYEKLLGNHKPKKSALIAAERKLVMICYGILKSGKPFDPNHAKAAPNV
jgi:transposase